MKPLRLLACSLVLLLAGAPGTAIADQDPEAGTSPSPTVAATAAPSGPVAPADAPTQVVTVTAEAPPAPEPPQGAPPVADEGGVADQPQPGVSVPRIMLTEFVTEPGQVVAGEAVGVSFTLQNMSRSTRVNNLKVTLTADEAGAFLPVNGSSSTYISTIRAEHSVSRTMALRTLPSLEERPYSLTLKVEYEDALANPYESSEQVAIPVTQTVRADTSSPQVMPQQIMAGQQATVTFSINNLGRNKLFNARAVVPEGQPVAPQEVFVGSIEPGAAGTVELTLQALSETVDPVLVQVTYEDAEGVVTTIDRPVELLVAPEVLPEEEFPIEEEWPVEEEPAGAMGGISPTVLAVGVAVLVVLLVGVAVLVRTRRRRREREQDSDLALLDPLVPTDSA